MTYRAYFAVRDSVLAPDGRPIGAVHGYLGMVTRLVATRRPDEVVHVYDHDWRPTARTKLYAGYKADRPPEPEDLTAQFVLLRGVLEALGATQAHATDWEAEDAIGGLCARAPQATASRSSAATVTSCSSCTTPRCGCCSRCGA